MCCECVSVGCGVTGRGFEFIRTRSRSPRRRVCLIQAFHHFVHHVLYHSSLLDSQPNRDYLRKQATREAITQHERNKAALRKFNDKWQLFKTLPSHDNSQAHHDHKRGQLKKRALAGAKPGADRYKQSVTSQPKITRFMTTTRHAVGHKRGSKRKQGAESRIKQAHRSTQVQEDTAGTVTDTDTEELPTTQDAKRQKIDRTGIG